MSTEILTVGDTRCVRPFDDVKAEAARLLEGPPPAQEQLSEVPKRLPSESVTSAPVQDDSVRARLADVARQEEKRRRLLAFLERETPAWNPDDHPDIDAAGGAAAWVKKMRREADRASLRRRRRARS